MTESASDFSWEQNEPPIDLEEECSRVAKALPHSLDVVLAAQKNPDDVSIGRLISSGLIVLAWALIVRALPDEDFEEDDELEAF